MSTLREAAARVGLRPIVPPNVPNGRPPGALGSVVRGDLKRARLAIHAGSMRGICGPLSTMEKIDIARGLLQLKKQKLIQNVWIDADTIRIERWDFDGPRRISWQRALELIQEHAK